MCDVRREHNRSIKQGLLGLSLPHLVVLPVLVRITRVPLEPLKIGEELSEDAHTNCI